MTLCLRCHSTNCIIGDKCGYCSCQWIVYLCGRCNTNPLLEKKTVCDECSEERKQLKVTESENAPSPLPPAPRKRVKKVRLSDKFTGKQRAQRVNKYYEQTIQKRRNKAAKDNFRRIKHGYDERQDLGDMDKIGNFSYEGRTCGSWQEEYGVVPLSKRERENANRTNGHLVPLQGCNCQRYMWRVDFPDHKVAHMNVHDACAFCKRNCTLDEHGHSIMW